MPSLLKLAAQMPKNTKTRKYALSMAKMGMDKSANLAMVGFPARLSRRHHIDILARVSLCRDYTVGSGKFEEAVKVWLSKEGMAAHWLKSGAFERALRDDAIKAMTDEGMFPKDPKGYAMAPACIGLAEIGHWHEQNSWSDDSYLALRADTPEIALIIKKAIDRALPITGGGVVGARGYRGSGWTGAGTEWAYHYNSFGIGD